MQESFVLFSPFTVKVLVRLEFILILVLTVSSKRKEKWSQQAASLYDKCNDRDCLTLRLSQLVRYLNRKTMGNNDKQRCAIIVSATNEETPYEQLLHYSFFFRHA